MPTNLQRFPGEVRPQQGDRLFFKMRHEYRLWGVPEFDIVHRCWLLGEAAEPTYAEHEQYTYRRTNDPNLYHYPEGAIPCLLFHKGELSSRLAVRYPEGDGTTGFWFWKAAYRAWLEV